MSSYTIESGVVSSGLSIAYGDTMYVQSGGSAAETTMTGGSAIVRNDGLVESTTMTGEARMTVSAYGSAYNTVLGGSDGDYNNPSLILSSGGTAELTTVSSGGYVSMTYGAELNSTTVSSGGEVNVYGGTVNNLTVSTLGRASFSNDGTLVNNLVLAGEPNTYTVASAGYGVTVNGATVTGGYLSAANSAAVNDVMLSGSGNLTLSGGATANNVLIDEGGSMTMVGNASAADVTVNCGGYFSAGFGYYGSYTIYEEDGLSSLGGAVRENGGAVYLGSATVVRYDSTLGAYGDYIYSSGVVYPVEILPNAFREIVYSNGKQGTVHSNTVAYNITAINGGLTVFDGGVVTGYTATPVTYVSSYTSTVWTSSYNEETGDWDYTRTDVPVEATVTQVGNLTVVAGGTVTRLVAQAKEDEVDDYWAEPYLNFEIAPGTLINGTIDGVTFATERGILKDASLKNAGLTYMDGASASRVTQTNGKATFMAGANAYDLNFSGTYVVFSSGAYANGVYTSPVSYQRTVYNMGFGDQDEEPEEKIVEATSGTSVTVSAGATVTGLNMDSQSYLHVQVASNTVLQGTSGGVAVNVSGGTFADASLGSTYVEVLGATVYDFETSSSYAVGAGTVSNLIVNPGAVVSAVDEEGVAVLNMVENGGAVWLGDGEKPENITSCSFASNTFSYEHLDGGEYGENAVTVHKNTVALDNIMFGGNLTVFSGGVVNNFYTVGSGMNTNHATFYSGAIVSNFDTVRYSDPGNYHPGNFDFYQGVQINVARLTDYDGITLFVTPETVITNASLDDVPFSVEDGVLSGFKGGDTGWFSDTIGINRGAQMVDCRIDQWANVNIWQGASGSGNTFVDGYIYLGERARDDESEEGGIALLEKTTLGLPPQPVPDDDPDYSPSNKRAELYVQEYGVVRDIVVNRSGELNVGSGGKLTGKVERAFGGQISIDEGGIFDFDLTTPDALHDVRIDDLGDVHGSPTYTITIDGQNQAAGTYLLTNDTDFEEYSTTDFYLVDITGTTYGYFSAYQDFELKVNEEQQYEYYERVLSVRYIELAGTVQPDFQFSLGSGNTVTDDGILYSNLYFTVDSDTVAPAYVMAPTVTADIATFTNSDVVLTAVFGEEAEIQEYSLDGESWMLFPTPAAIKQYGENLAFPLGVVPDMTDDGATLTVSANRTYYFRGTDSAGNVSDVTSFRVSNIDKVAPTAPTDLDSWTTENDDGSVTLTFGWGESTDDYSGIRKYIVSYREVGAEDFITVETPYKFFSIDFAGTTTSTSATDTGVVADGTVLPAETTVIPPVIDTESYEWSVRAVDYAGNVSEEATADVGIPGPVASASITAPTNGAVNVVIGSLNPDVAQYEYSLDDQRTWQLYELEGVIVSQNLTVWFRGITVNGDYTKTTFVKVDNIDLIPPDAPIVSASTTEPTNGYVIVTATFSNDSVTRECSVDGVNWVEYTASGLCYTDNGKAFFRGFDAAGNVSEVAEYDVTNIDKVPPTAPVTAAAAADTFEGLLVSAVFSEDSVVKEYSLDGRTWEAYTGAVPVREVGTVIFFRATDVAGNVSEVTEYEVKSLVPGPAAPTVSADVTAPTNGVVTVTAVFGEDAAVQEFSFDGQNWEVYTGPIEFGDNGIVYFRGTNDTGSTVTPFEVSNIDKVAPDAPAPFARTNELTNQDVLVFATFSDDSVKQEVSLDGVNWSEYSPNGVPVSENGIVYFRATDEAGNVSEVTEYEVSNIDKVAPYAPVVSAAAADAFEGLLVSASFSEDSVVKEYSLDGQIWEAYQDAVPVREAGVVIFFRGTDAAGNVSEVTEYEVKSLVPGPAAPTMEADVTTPTNGVVTVTATFGEDCVIREYSFDGQTWESTNGLVRFTENGIVYFRGTNADGYTSPVVSYEVNNIDKVAPEAPVVSASTTEPTNTYVTVTATFSNDSVTCECSADGENWGEYSPSGISFTENGKAFFRSYDAAGNVSPVAEYEVTNIDNIPPTAPVVSVSAAVLPAGKGLDIAAAFSEDSVKQEYSFDGTTWLEYSGAITVTEVGKKLYFRGTDAAGNVSNSAFYLVDKLSLAPAAPVAYADITEPTNQDVTVYATFDETATVRKYAINTTSSWYDYTDAGVVLTQNGTVYFACVDADGEGSDMTTFVVSNIDKTPPQKPVASADVTEQTDGLVTVTASFSNDSVQRQYSYDGDAWSDYPEDGITFEKNGYVFFRGIDAAGNASDSAVYEVANIVTAEPDLNPADNGWNDAVYDKKKHALTEAAGEVNSYDLTKVYRNVTSFGVSGSILFDEAGSISVDGMQNAVGGTRTENGKTVYDVDFVRVEMSCPGYVYFTVSASAPVNLSVWQYTAKDGASVFKNLGWSPIETGDNALTKQFFLERTEAGVGEYYIMVEAASPKKNGIAYYSVSLDAKNTVLYPAADNSDDWTDLKTNGPDGKVRKLGALEKHYDVATGFDDNILILDWVGPGDNVDYFEFTLEHAANLSFAIAATGAASFGIYSLKEGKTWKLTDVSSQKSLTQGGKIDSNKFTAPEEYAYALTTSEIAFDAGTYYLCVGAVTSKTPGEPGAYYTVDVAGTIAFQANNEDDWTDMKTKGAQGHVGNVGKLEDRYTEFEGFDDGALVVDWIGTGDEVDYFKFTLDHNAKLRFVTTATDAVSFSLSSLAGTVGNYKLKSQMKVTTLRKGAKIDENEYAFVDGYRWALTTSDVLLEAGTYYIGVKKSYAGKSGSADYAVDLSGKIFLKANNKDDGEKFRKDGSLLDVGSLGLLSDSKIGNRIEEDWVGFGDAVDYKTFLLAGPTKLNFTISATDSVKLTVYEVRKNSKGKATFSAFSKNVATISNKNGDTDFYGTASTGSIFLKAETGVTYCLCVESTNAKKGGDASYTIDIDSDGSAQLPIHKDPDGVDNSGLQIKTKGMRGGTVEIIDIDQWAKDSTFANGLKGYTGWVGYGDAVDTLGFTIPADTPINQISIRSTDEVTFTLSQVIRSGKSGYKTKSIISSTKLKAVDPLYTGYSYEFNSVTLNGSSKKGKDLGAGDYIIIVKSTNAAKGGNADYTLILRSEALETKNADALPDLSMPETSDTLAISDDLSLGRFAETSSAISSAVTDALYDKLGSVMNASWTTLA